MNTPPLARILLVDDEVDFTAMTALALEATGRYRVRQQSNPAEVVAVAREFMPDLILLDVMMPGMDGGDVLAQLEADPATRAIPVIFLTALVAGRETQDGSMLRGGRQFLPKPLSLEQLVERIEDALRWPMVRSHA